MNKLKMLLKAINQDTNIHDFKDIIHNLFFYANSHITRVFEVVVMEDDNTYVELKRHLISRIESIMSSSTELCVIPDVKIKLIVDHTQNQFFRVINLNQNDITLKNNIDLLLIQLIDELDLKPDRFKKCERCGQILYADIRNTKKFCNKKCAISARQKRYRERLKNVYTN